MKTDLEHLFEKLDLGISRPPSDKGIPSVVTTENGSLRYFTIDARQHLRVLSEKLLNKLHLINQKLK